MINSVIQGNCRELIKTLPEGHDFILVTDPPFNVGYHYNSYEDKMEEAEYYEMLKSLIDACGGKAVIIHYPEALHRLSIELGEAPRRVLSWVYNSNTRRQHRDIAFYGFDPDMRLVKQPYKNPKDKRIEERIERGIDGGALYDWFIIDQVKNIGDQKFDHPCQMPLKVMMNAIGVIPKSENLVIVEPFSGTGTTLVACRDLGVDFIGFEIDPKYVDICKARLADATPQEIKSKHQQLKLF